MPHAAQCCVEQTDGTWLAASMALSAGMFGGWWKSQIIPVKKQETMWPYALFPPFQRHLFFDKVPETVSDMLVGTYGKEYTFYQLCFPYPLVAFAGCGNRQHSGHCFSEIAFTDQSTRPGWGIQPGEPGALRFKIVHRDGQCTLSLVWTQRTKERFYYKVWQVGFADRLLALLLSLLAAVLQQHVTYVLFYILCLLMIDWWLSLSFSVSTSVHTFFFLTLFGHTPLTPFSFSPCIQSLYHWIYENLAQRTVLLMGGYKNFPCKIFETFCW